MAQSQSFIPVPAPKKGSPSPFQVKHIDLVVRSHNGDTLGVQDAWYEDIAGKYTAVITREGIEELFHHLIKSGAINLEDYLGPQPETRFTFKFGEENIEDPEYFNEALMGEPEEEMENDGEDARP